MSIVSQIPAGPKAELKALVQIAALVVGVDAKDIILGSRQERHVDARQLYYWLAIAVRNHNQSEAARQVRKHPSNVVHGVRRADALMQSDPAWAAAVQSCVALIESRGVFDALDVLVRRERAAAAQESVEPEREAPTLFYTRTKGHKPLSLAEQNRRFAEHWHATVGQECWP